MRIRAQYFRVTIEKVTTYLNMPKEEWIDWENGDLNAEPEDLIQEFGEPTGSVCIDETIEHSETHSTLFTFKKVKKDKEKAEN